MTGDWLFVTLSLLIGTHLAVLAYMIRQGATRGSRVTSIGANSGETAVSNEELVTDDTVYCPNCSTENERGYKFCRECLAELPTSMSFLSRRSGPRDRRTT